MRIVSIGEVMLELAPTDRTDHFAMSFAGDTFNTAWYLAQLRPDWQVDYFTAVGADKISDKLLGFAQAAGIGTDHIMRDPARTLGLYLIELQDGERSFNYWRSDAAARKLADAPELVVRALEGADVVFLSGITLAILQTTAREALLETLAVCRRSGTNIVFDPNLRPKLWTDNQTMCDAIMAAAAVCDTVLPSHEEEAIYFGDGSPAETIARYRAAGVGEVIAKNGSDALHFACGDETGVFHPEVLENVVDTTAAGDSFNAGYLAAILAGQTALQAIENASKTARQVIQHRGALVPLDGSAG